jgi:deferrochelatase/peroxidase EfeB
VDESPHDDSDSNLFSSNNFDYHPINEHKKCPFAAHTRKMRPRGDFYHDHIVIVRRGIPYGEEVTAEEAAERKSAEDKERGLLFVCYQSSIEQGFHFLTTRKHLRFNLLHNPIQRDSLLTPLVYPGWASNHDFPDNKTDFVGEDGPGSDAIVGQRRKFYPRRSIGLPSENEGSKVRMPLDSWVVNKGGEYFFAPSILALRNELTGPDIFDQAELERLRENA